MKSIASIAAKLFFATAGVALLSGCVAIPTAGQVQLGPEISNVAANDFLYFSPYDPPVGGSIGDIVQGFLSAGTGPQNDYAVARKYLADNLKTTWLPNSQVVVVDTLPDISVDILNNRASVQVHAAAVIDEGGRLTAAPDGSNNRYDFSLVREAGQWRIDQAPNLTIVSKPVFDVVFRSFALYFFDSQQRYLVPDVRWFPSRASTATRLVNALIDGPDLWLQEAVTNPLPKGAKLAIDAVTITDGVASVDLNSKVLATSSVTKGQIRAQLQATLCQITGVRAVQISVDRNIQDFPSVAPLVVPSLSLSPVILTKTAIANLSGTTVTPIDGTRALVQTLSPKDFSLTFENNWAAVDTSHGLYQASLVGFGAEPKLVDSRLSLLSPVFDRQGWLWSVGAGSSPVIKFFDQAGSSAELRSQDFAGRKILSFAVSPEGARLAVVVGTANRHEIWLFGIVRNTSGLPVRLSGRLKVSTMQPISSSISWLDGSTLAVLSQRDASLSQPREIVIGGFETELTGLPGLINLVGNKSAGTIFALTKNGDLMQYRASSWSRIQSQVLKVHFAN